LANEEEQARDYLNRIIFDCEQHLALGEDNPTAGLFVIALYKDDIADMYLHIVDRLTGSYNFAANALNTPRYEQQQAEDVVNTIREQRANFDVRVLADADAVASELANARRLLSQLSDNNTLN